MKRRLVVIAACVAAASCAAAQEAAATSGGTERSALLARGEAALAALQPAQALAAFEQAARISHSADTEIGVVRSHMQAGDFRRALGFAAHTAGAHLEETGGAALYAWLLHAGGQTLLASRMLEQGLQRSPGDPLLAQVAFQLRHPWPVATGALLRPPTRLAPYGETRGLPPGTSVVASATLAAAGTKALVPASALVRGARYWVRNGVGRLVEAQSDPAVPAHGLALLRLAAALPAQAPLVAAGTVFPGSIAYAVEYAPQPDAAPAWPLMKSGFVGAVLDGGATRALGVDLPNGSARGGPVFDASGRLAGVAVRNGAADSDVLVPAALLRRSFGDSLFGAAPAGPAPLAAPDAIYEPALGQALQLLRSAGRGPR